MSPSASGSVQPESRPRIIFMGTPDFAVPSLRALVAAGYVPAAVVTGPDKQRGRGQKQSPTAVKVAAEDLGITRILQPDDVKDPEFARQIRDLEPDIMVVVAFRILPESVFASARTGTFNLHGSLLPYYRGAAPINRAIMAGETETGVTTFLIQQKVDTGNVLIKRSMPIGPEETAGEVHDRMMMLGAEVVVETVKMLEEGSFQAQAQDDRLATPAPKIHKEDCLILWDQPAHTVHNHIRGLSPYPGAQTVLDGKHFKVRRSRVASSAPVDAFPGTIIESDERLVVACNPGSVELTEVQMEGKRAMSAADFLRGNTVPEGIVMAGA